TNGKWDREAAEILKELKRDREALEAVNRAIALNGNDRQAYAIRGKIHSQSKTDGVADLDKAIADYERALKPDDASSAATATAALDRMMLSLKGASYSNLAELYARKNAYDKAVEAMTMEIGGGENASSYQYA